MYDAVRVLTCTSNRQQTIKYGNRLYSRYICQSGLVAYHYLFCAGDCPKIWNNWSPFFKEKIELQRFGKKAEPSFSGIRHDRLHTTAFYRPQVTAPGLRNGAHSVAVLLYIMPCQTSIRRHQVFLGTDQHKFNKNPSDLVESEADHLHGSPLFYADHGKECKVLQKMQ